LSGEWIRRGLIVEPPVHLPWAGSHAMVPTVRLHGNERLELLFSPRDEQGESRVARAWFADLGTAPQIEPEPILSPGPLGAFDDSGVNPSCLVHDGDRWLLYYIGWTRGVSVRFHTAIGCAVSDDGGRTFERLDDGPVIGRSVHNPYFATSPWVLVEGGRWRMWYASGVRWEVSGGRPEPHYNIRHAESSDGVHWDCTGPVCIDFVDEAEHAIARPCVVKDQDRYRMWFSHRGDRYRIGYAESADGLSWERLRNGPTLGPAGDDWESEMVEYPVVFDFQGGRHLLYNGNGYGRTGIGHAEYRSG
jgi:hypothetical protein